MEELYNQLNKDGKYTKTFEEFQVQFGTPEKSEKLYSALNQAGDYTKSFDDFKKQFNVLPEGVIELTDEQVGKTNDSANADPAVESENNTDSQSANGLSESKGAEPISNWQSIKNSFSNMGEQVGDVYEYWFEDEGANAALDIATNSVYSAISGQDTIDDFVKEQGKDSWMAEGLGSEATLEAIKKYEIEQSKTKRTKGVIESFKDGNIGGVLAGTVNALTSMVGSVAYGAGTLGTGFFMDYVAENYIEYNKLKAENLGVTLPELITSGEADNAIPVGMGALSTGLELIGLGLIGKGVKGAVKGKGGNTGLLGSASKYLAEKLIYSKGARATMNVLGTGATEFTTEILQHASDQVNLELGRVAGTDEEAQIGKTFIDAITSEEGLEAGIQGFLGGAGMTSGSYSAKAMNTIRNVVDEDAANKSLIKLGTLEANLKAATDPTVRKGIEAQIEAQTIEISDLVNKGNDIYNSLSDGDISKIENLRDLGDAALFQVTELGKKLRRGDISQKQYELSKGGFEIEYKAARQGLIDMELEKNIGLAKEEASSKGLNFTELETTAEVDAFMNSDKVSEGNRKIYFDAKNKGSDISGFSIGNNIIINKELARKTGSINVGMHEVLHPVFSKLVGNAKEQGKMVRQFRKSMTSSQRRFVDAEMKKRGYTGKEYNTEYVTVFSDALRKKQINYDKTTFEKIGDAIVNVFKPVGYTNIGFESGKDVYNFIKEFDQSAEQGKLTAKAAEALKDIDLSDAGLQDELQASKTLSDDVKATLTDNITEIKNLAKENAEIAAKFNKEPIKGAKQVRLEREVIEGVKPLVEKIVTNRTKALYDKIANDAKRGVTREQFQESMRADIETMILNEYDATKQDLEKFTVSRAYLRANNLAKRLGIESVEEGGIKQDIDTAKGITDEKTETTKPKEPSVERGQATFDELDIVDDALIEDIKSELEKEIRTRVQKGTLAETVSVKKGRETYIVSWLENYVNKQLFKKLLKKVGAIKGTYPNTIIPTAYIDFLQDPKTFDIITKALPIKSIKKSYGKLFEMERIGREVTAEGNPVFRIKKIDKPKFFKYFVEGKKSTVLERQKQLFREILEPLAKQVIADYATPENIANLKEVQGLAPQESVDVVENIVIDVQLRNLESKLDRYKGEQAGFDIIQFSKNAIENYNDSEIAAIRKASGIPSTTSNALVLVEAIVQILRDTISPTATKLSNKKKLLREKLGEDLFSKLEEDFLYPLSSAYELKKQSNEYGLGTAAEQIVWDVYNKLPGIKVLSPRPKGYSGDTSPDLIIQNKKTKKRYIIEIKADKNARLVTFGVQDYTAKNPSVTRLTEDSADSNSILKQLKEDSPANSLKKFLNKVDAYFKKNKLELEKDSEGNIIIDKDILDILLGDVNLYSASKVFFKRTTESVINDIYRNKDVSVLSFLDIGNFNIEGVDSMYDLPVFKADIKLRGYLKQKAIANTNKVKLRFKIIAEFLNAASSDTLAETSTTPATSAISIKKSVDSKANINFSKTLNEEFNNIIEDVTGIESFKTFSEAKGKVRGQGKGKFKFFIPPSADDFAGLLYKLTGKGKAGEAQQAWFKEALFDPFAKAMREFESYKQNVTGIVNQLKKDIKKVPSGLKKVNETGFTNEVAVRVYLWAKNGYDINGLSETDKKELIAIVQANQDLLDFADQMDSVLEGYPEPQNDWLAGTITTDAINMINTTKRAEFLEAWQNNADAIFTKENFNKLRAAFGDNYVEAMQDMLYRMKTGRNRPSGANKLTNKFMNWVNDSVGTIMFFNTRSALLQTLSIVNFINWGDNNPMAAAKAFANQKQFWSDFSMLFNSDFLKQRRSGLKNDVNADDIANAAETATNKTKAVLSSLLKMGFLPTQIADSFAIAMGGASFVRNRINKYVSEGMDKQAATEQAFLDFQEIAEETQQSSRPDRVSQQQASPLGRIILAFANTPMQYMRLTKKAFLDLKNGRGDAKTNITKIAYYMAVQNIIFSSLQAALFAAAFDDDEEALENKQVRVANSMLDSILRGVGVYGAIASTLKNIAIEIKGQSEKDRPDYTVAAQRSLSISPPIDSKMRKLMGAGRAFSYKTTREKMVGFGLDNPAFYAGGQIVSALTNVPLDRALRKADNIRVAVDNDTKYWQSIALMLGYSQWDLGLVETSKNKKKKSGWGSTTKWKKRGSWNKEKGSWKK